MKLLLIEDEKRMAQALQEILRQEQYQVDHCDDGVKGAAALETGTYDLAVLDVMLPHKDGFSIAREARAKGITTPILMLTAKSDVEDTVMGLDCGADDYLTKPFLTKELLARQVGPNPWIANMQYESERMSSLIRQLLDLARAEQAAIQCAPLDFSRLVCGEALPFESMAYEQGVTL